MKNKHNLFRLIGALLFIVGVVIVVLILKSESIEPLVQGESKVIFGVPFLAVGGIMYAIATSNSRKVCDKCGKKMTGCAYQYQEVRRDVESGTGYLKVFVNIIATCPHCGKRKNFEKKFTVLPGGVNLQFQVDNFCRSKFGH